MLTGSVLYLKCLAKQVHSFAFHQSFGNVLPIVETECWNGNIAINRFQ